MNLAVIQRKAQLRLMQAQAREEMGFVTNPSQTLAPQRPEFTFGRWKGRPVPADAQAVPSPALPATHLALMPKKRSKAVRRAVLKLQKQRMLCDKHFIKRRTPTLENSRLIEHQLQLLALITKWLSQ